MPGIRVGSLVLLAGLHRLRVSLSRSINGMGLLVLLAVFSRGLIGIFGAVFEGFRGCRLGTQFVYGFENCKRCLLRMASDSLRSMIEFQHIFSQIFSIFTILTHESNPYSSQSQSLRIILTSLSI